MRQHRLTRFSPSSFIPPLCVAVMIAASVDARAQAPEPKQADGKEATATTPADGDGKSDAKEPAAPADAGDLPEPIFALSVPSPAEYYLALAKATNPRWRKWYREIALQPPTQRAKVAAGLGTMLAEAHIAGMARDGQRLRNVCSEIAAFAKILGLSEEAGPRVAAIEAAAERGEWSIAHLNLETLVVVFAGKLLEQRDDDLGHLLHLGLWVRVLHVGSGVVTGGDVEDYTMAVGGKTLPVWLNVSAAQLSEGCRADEDIAFLVRQVEKLSRIWALDRFEAERKWTLEEVKDSHDRLDGIVDHLTER